MSYTKTFNDKVRGKVEVPYGRPSKGYTKTINVELPVQVTIQIDTEPFDVSAGECGQNLNMLSSALTETEAAELKAKETGSLRVAESIITGFFSYIRSEISQQANELSKVVESNLILMRELMKSSRSKKVQMEGDFKRISDRYSKIFNDLNKEITNRIFDIDKQAFDFVNETNKFKVRALNNDLVSTVPVFGLENSELFSKISSSVNKKRVFDTINQIKLFLLEQKRLEQSLKDNVIGDNFSGDLMSPVCYVETSKNKIETDKRIIIQQFIDSTETQIPENVLIERFSSDRIKWKSMEEEERRKLQVYFDSELEKRFKSTDSHVMRVKENIRQMYALSSINVTL